MNNSGWERIEVRRQFLVSEQRDPGAGTLWKGLTELMAQAESVTTFSRRALHFYVQSPALVKGWIR